MRHGPRPRHTTPPARRGRRALIWAGAALVLAPGRVARALERPAGAVVLTVGGRVAKGNGAGAAHFDMAMLAALPQRTLTTRTPWYTQPRHFTGPLLRDVLAAAGASGSQLRLIALNDYRVDMPYEDTQQHDVVIARLLDGQPMAVRDKGPLFVIYPFDDKPELRRSIYYSRCAWQLRTIDVR